MNKVKATIKGAWWLSTIENMGIAAIVIGLVFFVALVLMFMYATIIALLGECATLSAAPLGIGLMASGGAAILLAASHNALEKYLKKETAK